MLSRPRVIYLNLALNLAGEKTGHAVCLRFSLRCRERARGCTTRALKLVAPALRAFELRRVERLLSRGCRRALIRQLLRGRLHPHLQLTTRALHLAPISERAVELRRVTRGRLLRPLQLDLASPGLHDECEVGLLEAPVRLPERLPPRPASRPIALGTTSTSSAARPPSSWLVTPLAAARLRRVLRLIGRRRCALWLFGGKQLEEVKKEVRPAVGCSEVVKQCVWLGSAQWLLPLLLTVRQGSQGRPRTFALALHHATRVAWSMHPLLKMHRSLVIVPLIDTPNCSDIGTLGR